MVDKKLIVEAVARGWCSPENEHKIMDDKLAYAIVDEVFRSLCEEEARSKGMYY